MTHTLHSFCVDKKEKVEERIMRQIEKILKTKALR
jgi:hypothetical protein